MSEVVRTEVWTFEGARWDGAKLRYYYLKDNQTVAYKKAMTPEKPGAMFTVSLTDDGSIFYKGPDAPIFAGWDQEQDRGVLEAKHREAHVSARMARQAKADMEVSALDELLAPLAKEYSSRNPIGQAALIGTIIRSITKRSGGRKANAHND